MKAGKTDTLLARHWRGQLELPRSFWLHSGAPWLTGWLLLAGGIWCVTVSGAALQAAALLLLVLLPLWLAVAVWGGVGAWRASARYLQLGGALLWAWGVRAALALGAAFTAAVLALDALPQLPAWLALAVGSDSPGGLQSAACPNRCGPPRPTGGCRC